MKQRQHKSSSLMPVMMMLVWSLCHGCHNVPGPSCRDELPNTIHIINRLKKSLKDLHKTFVVCQISVWQVLPSRMYSALKNREYCAEGMHNIRIKSELTQVPGKSADEGYGGRLSRGPICILGNSGISDQSMDLSSIETRLCQYAQCLQHFVNNTREISSLPPSINRALTVCQNFVGHLESTIQKMKLDPSASCTSSCTVPWSFAELTWEEIIKGPRLVQELLTYLEHVQFRCS